MDLHICIQRTHYCQICRLSKGKKIAKSYRKIRDDERDQETQSNRELNDVSVAVFKILCAMDRILVDDDTFCVYFTNVYTYLFIHSFT